VIKESDTDPVISDLDWLGLLADALLSPDEGRILRNSEEDMISTPKDGNPSSKKCLVEGGP